MIDTFEYREGLSPLVISVPHDGRNIPYGIAEKMTPDGLEIPDTDWHVRRLYDFFDRFDASLIRAEYSRYVVDLNRSADDAVLYEGQVGTGLCPQQTFAGQDIYDSADAVSDEEQRDRVEMFWRPYHERLAQMLGRVRAAHGFALLWDAHSIRGEVPRLFDGQLPDLNIGTNNGASCSSYVEKSVVACAEQSDYSVVVNARFRGGYITRHYGVPAGGVHAIQLEIAQRCYMDEFTGGYDAARAGNLADLLERMLRTYIDSASEAARRNS